MNVGPEPAQLYGVLFRASKVPEKRHASLHFYPFHRGRDSAVGIATRYGLDGPGIDCRWGEIFRNRTDLSWGPWVPGLSRG